MTQVQIKNVPDFKINGLWVQKYSPKHLECHTTVSGVLWTNMTQRCKTGGALQKRYPAYKGCVNEFANFQEFAEWCQDQQGYGLGWQLDKDILVKNNKSYSPTRCCFVPTEINRLFTLRARVSDSLPRGAYLDKSGNYRVKVSCKSLSSRSISLGPFKTSEEAFMAYKRAKENVIQILAIKWKEQLREDVFNALMSWEIDIND